MPLHTVEPLRLYRQIAGQIAALIDDGEFPVGSRLPAERELATLLGVSRTSVREAVISLEIAGRVEVRVGSGIFVAEPRATTFPVPGDEGPSPFELLAARHLIEGEIAAVAARPRRRAISPPCAPPWCACASMPTDFRKRDAADQEFHVRIAAATGNGSLALVVQGCGTSGAASCGSASRPISTRRRCATACCSIIRRSSTPSSSATPTRHAPRCTSTWRGSSASFSGSGT